MADNQGMPAPLQAVLFTALLGFATWAFLQVFWDDHPGGVLRVRAAIL